LGGGLAWGRRMIVVNGSVGWGDAAADWGVDAAWRIRHGCRGTYVILRPRAGQ